MSSLVKYRIREVAADFGMTPKEVSEIVGKYFEKPKSNTQVLEDAQLNVVFEYITRQNQVASLEQVVAATAKDKRPAPAAEKLQDEKPAAKQPAAQAQAPASQAAPSSPSGRKISPAASSALAAATPKSPKRRASTVATSPAMKSRRRCAASSWRSLRRPR